MSETLKPSQPDHSNFMAIKVQQVADHLGATARFATRPASLAAQMGILSLVLVGCGDKSSEYEGLTGYMTPTSAAAADGRKGALTPKISTDPTNILRVGEAIPQTEDDIFNYIKDGHNPAMTFQLAGVGIDSKTLKRENVACLAQWTGIAPCIQGKTGLSIDDFKKQFGDQINITYKDANGNVVNRNVSLTNGPTEADRNLYSTDDEFVLVFQGNHWALIRKDCLNRVTPPRPAVPTKETTPSPSAPAVPNVITNVTAQGGSSNVTINIGATSIPETPTSTPIPGATNTATPGAEATPTSTQTTQATIVPQTRVPQTPTAVRATDTPQPIATEARNTPVAQATIVPQTPVAKTPVSTSAPVQTPQGVATEARSSSPSVQRTMTP